MPVKTNYVKNGSNYFRVTATVGKDSEGKPIRKEFYGKSKSDAESKRDEYLAGIKAGLGINYKEVKVGELMHVWIFEILRVSANIKPSTFDRYEWIYRNQVKGTPLYHHKLHEIRSLDIQRHYNFMYDEGKTSKTIETLNKLLKTFFNYAVDEDFIVKNPCKKIVIPGEAGNINEEDDEIRVLSTQEVTQITGMLKQDTMLQMVVLFNLGTGLRQGELLALTLEDIDFDKSEVNVSKNIKLVRDIAQDGTYSYKTIVQTPKTKGSIRRVPIPKALIPVLKNHILLEKEKHQKNGVEFTPESLIFTTDSCKHVDARNLSRAWDRLLNRAEVEHKKFHSLRNTYATRLFENGVPLKTVQKLLGHSSLTTTEKIYISVMPKEKHDAADKLNAMFEDIV